MSKPLGVSPMSALDISPEALDAAIEEARREDGAIRELVHIACGLRAALTEVSGICAEKLAALSSRSCETCWHSGSIIDPRPNLSGWKGRLCLFLGKSVPQHLSDGRPFSCAAWRRVVKVRPKKDRRKDR